MSDDPAKRLYQLFAQLPVAQREQLLDYAEFLLARHGASAREALVPIPAPQNIARPAQESVIKAIKRLSATYPMVNRNKMLNETSLLMMQHVMHGRDAVEVIDDLEVLFREHYERLVKSER